MFDGSHFSIEENVEKTKELVAVAHQLGLSIEAEVGSIGGEGDGVVGAGECADPNECKAIADLGVDMLAAGMVIFTENIQKTGQDLVLKLLMQFRKKQVQCH